MKKFYSYYFLSMCVMALIMTGCSDGAVGDDFADTQYAAKGAVVSATNVQTGFFDQVGIATSSIAFDLQSKGETVSGVDVLVSYNGGGEALLTTSTVSSTVNVSFTDVLTLMGIAEANVAVGDQAVFAFDATTSSGKFRSSKTLTVPVACASDLGGTYDYVSTGFFAVTGTCPAGETTGSVTFTDMGGGTYLASDLGFGQYGSTCWNDSPATSGNATFQDVCNEIISGGLDQYGLTYIWVITDVSGSDLSMSWTNDYGDGGDVVITRPDGTDWPALFTK